MLNSPLEVNSCRDGSESDQQKSYNSVIEAMSLISGWAIINADANAHIIIGQVSGYGVGRLKVKATIDKSGAVFFVRTENSLARGNQSDFMTYMNRLVSKYNVVRCAKVDNNNPLPRE